jgi:hypothetical protein
MTKKEYIKMKNDENRQKQLYLAYKGWSSHSPRKLSEHRPIKGKPYKRNLSQEYCMKRDNI